MTQHSVKVDEYVEPRTKVTRFEGFEEETMTHLAQAINRWLDENPNASIISVHHAAGEGSTHAANDRWPIMTALIEYRR